VHVARQGKALGNVECIYTGPIEHEPASQVQIIQDLVTQGVDGLAISVSDADAAVGVIKQARDAGIAVITFDADSPKSARQAYVGTNNKEMGAELGRQLVKLHPQPGIYITQSGGPSADNLNERLAGLNDGWPTALRDGRESDGHAVGAEKWAEGASDQLRRPRCGNERQCGTVPQVAAPAWFGRSSRAGVIG
jgi:ABC-type xylose transport system substrate-binding protein